MKLIKAIELNYVELVKELINKDNVNDIVYTNNWTALHYACYEKKLDIVKYLISIGVDLDLKDVYNQTPLDVAIKYNRIEVKAYLESLTVKEVTMEEVCKKFGCNVKIIKGE